MAVVLTITLGLLAGCGDSGSSAPQQAAPVQTTLPTSSPATSQAPPEAATAEATPSASVIPPPIDLTAFASREELMESMGAASRKVGSSNLDEARAAAVQIGEYSLAARHPRFEPQGAEYERLAIELWQANQVVQIAMGPNGNRAILQEALRTQRAACQTCHEVFRIEEQ
jgi:cytochrome c556